MAWYIVTLITTTHVHSDALLSVAMLRLSLLQTRRWRFWFLTFPRHPCCDAASCALSYSMRCESLFASHKPLTFFRHHYLLVLRNCLGVH
ncbi:uncharacterized protein BDV14DRAFT_130658 [Aspergillus stella-maris]|uniref:uncharacterized protein n=1 Tax=Aspergillus stella-maris TaxID=1810926 RepID=UPI003CCE39B6